MKYKICKLVDGNGKEWYQVKEKRLLFWKWIKVARGPLEIAYYEPLTFNTFSKAKEWIADLQKCSEYGKKSRKIKVVECVEV